MISGRVLVAAGHPYLRPVLRRITGRDPAEAEKNFVVAAQKEWRDRQRAWRRALKRQGMSQGILRFPGLVEVSCRVAGPGAV